jgi:hypothetical protein
MKPEHIHCATQCDWYGDVLSRCMSCHTEYLQAKAELIE